MPLPPGINLQLPCARGSPFTNVALNLRAGVFASPATDRQISSASLGICIRGPWSTPWFVCRLMFALDRWHYSIAQASQA